MSKVKPRGCKWEGTCDCSGKERSCEDCKHYHCVDSGFGECYALPEIVMVAWCKDTCALFQK